MVIVIWKSILKSKGLKIENNPKLQEIIDDTARQLKTFETRDLFANVHSQAYGKTKGGYVRTLRNFTKSSLTRYMMLSDNYYYDTVTTDEKRRIIPYWRWTG